MGWKICAIDGLAKAGKSTLANQLIRDLPNTHLVQLDDFFLPRGERRSLIARNYDLARLTGQVFEPLLSGRSAKYQRFDWAKGQVSGPTVEIPPQAKVIVEGTFSLDVNLRYAYDASIFIDTPDLVRLERLGESGVTALSEEERLYLYAMDPKGFASTVLSGVKPFPESRELERWLPSNFDQTKMMG